jgi:hypothetical protein
VFTARYALSAYMKRIRFVFKGLIFRSRVVTVCTTLPYKNCAFFPRTLFVFSYEQVAVMSSYSMK